MHEWEGPQVVWNRLSTGAEVEWGARTWPRPAQEWGGDAYMEFHFLPRPSLGACHTLAGSSLSSAFPQDEDVDCTPWRAASAFFPERRQTGQGGVWATAQNKAQLLPCLPWTQSGLRRCCGGPECCCPWGQEGSDMTGQLNNNKQ